MKSPFSKSFTQECSEFINALKEPFTWNPFANSWFCFGFLWGTPIPFVILGVVIWAQGNPVTLNEMRNVLESHKSFWIYGIHPLIFGIIFGAMGSIRRKRDRHIDELLNSLSEKSKTDPLSEIVNRKYFLEIYQRERLRQFREKGEMSLVLFEVDYFKSIEDKYGHEEATQIVSSIGQQIKDNCRSYDLVSHWEEAKLLVLFTGCHSLEAEKFAKRTSQKIKEGHYYKQTQDIHCTVSAGIAQCSSGESFESNFGQVNEALHEAKSDGTNNIQRYSYSSF